MVVFERIAQNKSSRNHYTDRKDVFDGTRSVQAMRCERGRNKVPRYKQAFFTPRKAIHAACPLLRDLRLKMCECYSKKGSTLCAIQPEGTGDAPHFTPTSLRSSASVRQFDFRTCVPRRPPPTSPTTTQPPCTRDDRAGWGVCCCRDRPERSCTGLSRVTFHCAEPP